jgi:uncharacterized protein YlbG (UPF0298 family)
VRIIMTISLIFFFILPIFPFSDQSTTERMLRENRSFIEFIGLCVSNFGKDRVSQYREKFFEIYQFHFNAQVFFLQSDYKNAFSNVRSSQNKQTQLFEEILRSVYLEDAKDILDRFAPYIIRSKNARARLYLTLGYRDRAVSRNFEKVGNATRPKLFSYKLHKYIEAIKFARRAKRYGFLALFESQDAKTKRDIYVHLLEMERESGNKFYNRFLKHTDKTIMDEIDKTFEEYEEEVERGERKGTESLKEKKEGEKGEQNLKKDSDNTFEKKIERRVRFRKEKILAKHILNLEFDRTEESIREYVEDFNFKLVLATFEVLAARKKGEDMNYNSFFIHHYDNYSRLPEKEISLLEEFSKVVKVADDVPKIKEGKEDSGTSIKKRDEKKSKETEEDRKGEREKR